MAIHEDDTSSRIFLEPDGSWPDTDLARLDPGLYWLVALAEAGEWEQVFWRTGMRSDADSVQYLPLLLALRWSDISAEGAQALVKKLGLVVPGAYFTEERPTHVTASLPLQPGDLHPTEGSDSPLRRRITASLRESRVSRFELPGAIQAFNEDAQGDIGLGPGAANTTAYSSMARMW